MRTVGCSKGKEGREHGCGQFLGITFLLKGKKNHKNPWTHQNLHLLISLTC